jgi:cytochrome c553
VRTPAIAATALAALGAALSMTAFAQSDQTAARSLAATCANCHGTNGFAAAGSPVPGLAGQPKDVLVQKMKAFKEGKGPPNTIMTQLAKGYTEPQIEALSGYFAAQKAP